MKASLYSSAELRDISANTATIPMMTTIRHLPQKLVFGLNGTYTYKLSDDKKTAELTNTDTKAVSTLKKTDDPDFIPTPDKDASIDDKLVGCWKSESGEYLCFDKSGIMYQNLF